MTRISYHWLYAEAANAAYVVCTYIHMKHAGFNCKSSMNCMANGAAISAIIQGEEKDELEQVPNNESWKCDSLDAYLICSGMS